MNGFKIVQLSFLVTILVLTMVGLSSASISNLECVVRNTCIQLPQSCASCTYNNISSVLLPNKKYSLFGSFAMARDGSNYNLTYCNTSQIGIYSVSGLGDVSGVSTTFSYTFPVYPTCPPVTPVQITFYIIFFVVSIIVAFLSFLLIKNNKFSEDKIDYAKMYQIKRVNEAKFYVELAKRKLWIVGLFGIYLSITLAVSIFTQIAFSLALDDMYSISSNLVILLLWAAIPFIIFWIIYIILYFYKSVEASMRYQFGVGIDRSEKR